MKNISQLSFKSLLGILLLFAYDFIIYLFSFLLAYITRKLLNLIFSLPILELSYHELTKQFLYFIIPYLYCQSLFHSYKYSTNFNIEKKLIIKSISAYFIIMLSLLVVTKRINETSRILLSFHFIYLFLLLYFTRYTFKHKIFEKLIKPKLIYLGQKDIYEKIYKTSELVSYSSRNAMNITIKPFFTNSPLNWGEVLEYLMEIKQEGSELIILLDSKGVNPKDLAFILAKIRPKVFQILLLQKINEPINSMGLDPDALIKGYSIAEFNGGLLYLFNLRLKRFFDLFLALIGLPFFILSFFLLAIVIKLESKGSVLYTHERIGKDGKPFKLYKFRTMYSNGDQILREKLAKEPELKEEWERYRKLKEDPRITRIGKFLRRFSLDELPQIINVLKGEMSLVGPRPVTREELKVHYREYASLYELVPPGLSGLWQVSGRNELCYEKRVALDVYYILNWSLRLDLFILFKTIPAIFSGKGAY